MLRMVVNALEAPRVVAALGALGVSFPAAASQGASAPPSWVAPALLALAIVGLAVVALRATGTAERVIAGKSDRTASGIFVVTRDAGIAHREAPVPLADAAELRPARGAVAPHDADLPGPEHVIRLLSARMDQVSYEPGAPNVLSMTKRLEDDGAGAAAQVAVRCTPSDDRGETVVAVEGTLDTVTLAEVVQVLDAVVSARPRVVVLDLSGLHHVDAAGAAAIGRLAARCREHGGEVRAVGLARQPRALFRLLRLDRALNGR
jgi:anti-anti-sigma factor